jgi:DNA-binding transcriptional ArsR family regulator
MPPSARPRQPRSWSPRPPDAGDQAPAPLSGVHWPPPRARADLDSAICVSEYLRFVAAYQESEQWAALGDPTRRAIVECLAARPRAVGELAAVLPVSRPAVSQALRVLKDAGLVTERAAGTRRIYRLNPHTVAALRDQLDAYWSRALAGYEDSVEETRVEQQSEESS